MTPICFNLFFSRAKLLRLDNQVTPPMWFDILFINI